MLKRILSANIALLATIVALVIYWMVFMPWLHFFPIRSEPWIKLVIALIAMGLAIYLFARWRTWPALLFLVGSIPVVLVNISMGGWGWRMQFFSLPLMSLDFLVRQIATIGVCFVDVYLLCLWAYASIRTGLWFFWLFVFVGVCYVALAVINVAFLFAWPQIQGALGPLYPAFLQV